MSVDGGGAFKVLLLLLSGATAAVRELDFPPVDLVREDLGLSVSFTHPRLFYEELKLKDNIVFNFAVSSDVGDFDSFCSTEETCKSKIWFPEDVERCVTLNGSLFGGKLVGEVMFRETGPICLSLRPPTNVTLSCLNLNVAVSWDYGGPRTRFRVQVQGSTGHHVNETTDHQYDLRRFVWETEDRYMGFHYVTVTAVEGGAQSEPVASRTFTFNSLRPAEIKCKLDFPPVDLDESDSGAELRFENPLHFYRDLKEASKPKTATFKFTVVYEAGEVGEACTVREEVCRCDVVFPDGVEKCVRTLKGVLFDGSGVRQVEFRETGRVCASKPSKNHVLALSIMLLLLGASAIVLIIFIVKVKAWTMKTPGPPNVLIPDPHRDGVLRYAPVSSTDISAVSLAEPCKNPSVSSEEEEMDEEDEEEAGFNMEGGLPAGYRRDDESVEIVSISEEEEEEEAGFHMEGGLPAGYGRDNELVEEEDLVSPYDRPHANLMEMGD